ncbi:MAG: hypothetical protein GY744_00345, partial [Gammaproteobacteria bacterium]|nr:hypothetical protein [Gammaproteobacteria bacterium]
MIGYNPITKESVDKAKLLAEILDSVPFGDKLAKFILHLGEAAGKVMTWFKGQFSKAGFTWTAIKQQFSKTVDSLGVTDLMLPPKAAYKIVQNFVIPVGKRAIKFVTNVAKSLFGKIFEWLLAKLGPHSKRIMGFLSKVSSLFMTIVEDPIAFAKNLGAALKDGFNLFRKNLVTHLSKALAKVVFGPLKINPPEKITFSSMVGLVMQVLDLTYKTGIRPKLVKRLGEKRISLVEKSIAIIQEVNDKGIVVLWDKLKLFMGNLKDLVIDKLKEWLITRVVITAITKLAKFLVPGGAVVEAITSIYAMFKVFLDRWEQIETVFTSIFSSISKIVAGKTDDAAKFIDRILGKGLSLLLGFFFNWLGLGGIATKVREIIKSIKERIHAALDRLVGYIIKLIGKLFGKAKFAVGKALQWWKRRKSIRAANNKKVTLSISRKAAITQVMIKASPERRYTAYLDARKPEMKTAEQQAAMEKAKKQAAIIERRKSSGESDEQVAGIKLSAFNTLAEQLQIISGGTPTPISQVSYGPMNADQGGSEMTASILSNDHAKGSRVSDSPPIYTNLYHMRKGKGPPYYIQGHLLNNNLGGPGKRYNLSPLTTRANGKHLHNVEKHIKKWVHSRRDPIVMYYHVKVNYPSLASSARFNDLNTKAEETRTKAEKRELANLQQQRLATSFSCNAHKLKYDNGAWAKDSGDTEHSINYTVENK